MATTVLVRPDGHIAYRGDAVDVVALTRYLDRFLVARVRGAVSDGAVPLAEVSVTVGERSHA